LERFFKEGMSEKEAVELAERAMREAISRDALSGDGIDLLIITNRGNRMEFIPIRTA
jgi:proteasome beta subunit